MKSAKRKMNKKGSILDNLYLSATFFGIAIFLIAVLIFWKSVSTPAMETEFWGLSSIGLNILAEGNRAYAGLDNIFILAYFGIHLGVLVLAFMLRSHPIIYVPGILVAAILVLVAAPLSNAYEEFSAEPDFASAVNDLPKTDYIMKHYPTFEVVWAFLTIIVMAGLAKNEGFI